MSYKLQLIGCTSTVHTHNGNHVTNLSHSPTGPLILRTTQLHIQTHYLLLLIQLKTDLCAISPTYIAVVCAFSLIPGLLCTLTKKVSYLPLYIFWLYVRLLHNLSDFQTPQIYSLNFYFLLLHFLLFCNKVILQHL